jgi:hypothetical protein
MPPPIRKDGKPPKYGKKSAVCLQAHGMEARSVLVLTLPL